MSMPVLVKHEPGCRYARQANGGHSDAARRLSDTYNLHLVAGQSYTAFGAPNPSVGRFFCVRLADGTGDGVLYDSYGDAVRHQHHNEQLMAYFRIVPHGMSVCAAESQLRTHRLFFDAGWRLPDPRDGNGGRTPITLESQEANGRLLAALARGDWITGRTN